MLAVGHDSHHSEIAAASVVASLNPCAVSGFLSPGFKGNTGKPCAAYQSAALIIEFGSSSGCWNPVSGDRRPQLLASAGFSSGVICPASREVLVVARISTPPAWRSRIAGLADGRKCDYRREHTEGLHRSSVFDDTRQAT